MENGRWPGGTGLEEENNLSVGRAQACILQQLRGGGTAGVEEVPLAAALGRVLADEVLANRDVPPSDVSAMDGFAVRSADLAAGGVLLTVVEDIRAGDRPQRRLAAGECARIMTGAPLPEGADSVVRVEDTHSPDDGRVEIRVAAVAGLDVRRRGEAMRRGDAVLARGTEITPGVVGVLATVKQARVSVYRRPSVAILSTGDELEALDAPFDPARIPESNSYALMAQVQSLGIEPVRLGIARDDPDELAALLRRGLAYDVLLVSGGSSVGVHDHVRPTLVALGVRLHFWCVEMKPGHPVLFGTAGEHLVFGLPGNPVSSMVCFEQFVAPALHAWSGGRQCFRRSVMATLSHAVKHRPGRVEFVRVRLQTDAAGGLLATSTGSQSSGDLASMARADGLLIVPADSVGLAAGERVRVQLLDGGAWQATSDFSEEGA